VIVIAQGVELFFFDVDKRVRMINFLDGWVNKAERLGDGNDSNKTKSI